MGGARDGVEVCTGFKLKPEPGPYLRSFDPTRPAPKSTVKFRARTRPEISQQIANRKQRCCISRWHATVSIQIHKESDSSRLGHFTRQKKKHLPVMKVNEHQVQRSHKFCRAFEWLYGTIIPPPCLRLRLISIRPNLNQTRRCGASLAVLKKSRLICT